MKKRKKDGDPVYFDEIDNIVRISLPDDDNPNWGHLTMLHFVDRWYIYFDFRTNRQRAYERYQGRKEWLEAAQTNLKGSKRVFIDNLYSAAESFVTSQLFIISEQKYVTKPTHKSTAWKYNEFIKIGNYKDEFKTLFNKLSGLRNSARYYSNKFTLSDSDAQEMLKTAHELKEFTFRKIQ